MQARIRWNDVVAVAIWALFPLAGVVQAEALKDGEPVTVEIAEATVNNDFYVDVPPATTAMVLRLEGPEDALDLDLYVNDDGRFPDNAVTQFVLREIGDYWLRSDSAQEWARINTTHNPPLRPGRWHLALQSGTGSSASVEATLEVDLIQGPLERADIEVVFDDTSGECKVDGWNDDTPFEAEGGNDAETLGEARRAALKRAVSRMERRLTSPVDLTLQACWNDLDAGNGDDGDDDGPNMRLAEAFATQVFRNTPGLAKSDTWYDVTAAARLAGTEPCGVVPGFDCDQPEMQARFNPRVDREDTLNGGDWYYGFDQSELPRDDFDFITVAMHEVTHGLGFGSLVAAEERSTMNEEAPTKPGEFLVEGQPGIYDRRIVFNPDDGDASSFPLLTREQRAEALKSGNQLQWATEEAANSPLNVLSGLGDGYVWLHAPAEPIQGTSVQHLHTEFDGELMLPALAPGRTARELGLARAMLDGVGWSDEPKVGFQRGIWFDRAHNGHGFDIQRLGDTWFVLLYSYDETGKPVWYGATGTIDDGMFTTDDAGLVRFVYDETGEGPSAVPDSAFSGELSIDFNATADDAACRRGPDRSDAAFLARAEWRIAEQSGAWCLQPFRFAEGSPERNHTGSWFAPEEPGWGLTFYQQGDGNPAAAVLYYFDDQGNPRWALGQTQSFRQDSEIAMDEFRGYCPGCEPTAARTTQTRPGNVDLRLSQRPAGEGIRADIDVRYQGEIGGRWLRKDVSLELLSDPAP